MNTKNYKLLEYKFLKNMGFNLFGAYNSYFLGDGIDFSEINKYNIGDSLKKIDWKTTARKNELYIKQFIQEKDLQTLFLCDLSQSMDFGSENITKKEIFLEILYALGSCSINNNDSFGAYFYDDEILGFQNFGKGNENLIKIFDKIENIKSKTQTKNINIIFEKLVKLKTKKTLIFVLTDDLSFGENIFFKILAKENKIVVINIFDKIEVYLEKQNFILKLKQKNNFININLNNQEKINLYNNLRIKKINDFKNNLIKNNSLYIQIKSIDNIYKKLLEGFLG